MKSLLAIIVFFSSFYASYACSCVVNLPEEEQLKQMKEVDAIFYGQVVSIGEKRIASRDDRIEYVKPIIFKILRIWKGEKTREITVEANAHDSCQFNTEVGQTHLVYAYKWKESDALNYMHYCSVDRFDKPVLEKFYGAGEVPAEESQSAKPCEVSESFLSMIWQRIVSFFS